MNSMSVVGDADVVGKLWAFLVSTQVEILLFITAMLIYFLLLKFGNMTPKNIKSNAGRLKAKAKLAESDFEENTSKVSNLGSEEHESLNKSFQVAFDNGDYHTASRCWNSLKKSETVPSLQLAHIVESMQRLKKDNSFILRELKAYFKKYPSELEMSTVNDLLETLAKRLDSELMEKILELLSSLGKSGDQRTYEIFLNMYFTTRSFQEVRGLVAEMKAKMIPLTLRSTIIVIKTALKMNEFDEALFYFRQLKAIWKGKCAANASPSMAPGQIVTQLVELACKNHQLVDFLQELPGMPLTEEAVVMMLEECIRQKAFGFTQKIEQLAREQQVPLTDAIYSLLIKSASAEGNRVQHLFDEVINKGLDITSDFALAVIAFCSRTGNVSMVDQLYQHAKPKQIQVLSALVRFYADCEQHEKACDVYEKDLLQVAEARESQRAIPLDARMERSLMNAALRCGRSSLAKNLLDSSPSDVAKHIAMIRSCAAEKNLSGAMSVFDSLKRSGVELNSVIYNTVLDACVESSDIKAAESWMQQTKEVGMADVVSFNTLIKAHLANDNFEKALCLIDDMKKEGLQPNRVTFNELINSMVTTRWEARRSQVWEMIEKMKAAGVKPNQVTCSILLKNINKNSSEDDILKTMDLISSMDEAMDEVLLSSVVEACVRIGKPDMLAAKLKQLQGHDNIAVNGSHTFGSLIKAYGHAKDIDGVWRCWKEMRNRHIKPTSITLGCMVEAVVSNGDTEGAYDLIHQMQEDEQCLNALNSVIFCSVLKGFTREKKIERVWAVYEEMNKRNIELSIVTYNTLIDACARCGRMENVPDIIQDMKKHGIRPTVITYSTMMKGHCQLGDIQTGFAILEQMKRETRLKPDEIMYNSLLDGCAQNNLVDEGLRILGEMKAEGVQPSNFTLSILVKLMNRARKLDNAFTLVDEISRQYNFRPNVHVYTNLVQACTANRQLARGMSVLETMIHEKIQPDNRTYAILIRSSISSSLFDQADGLIRAALGLPGALSFLAHSQAISQCPNLDYALVNETLCSFVDHGCVQEFAVPLVSDIKSHKPKVRIDSTTQRKIMSYGMAQVTGSLPSRSVQFSASPTKGSGKGYGKGRNRNM